MVGLQGSSFRWKTGFCLAKSSLGHSQLPHILWRDRLSRLPPFFGFWITSGVHLWGHPQRQAMAQHLFVASKMDKLNQKPSGPKLFTNPPLLWQCNFRQVKSKSTGCSPVERSFIGWCLSYKYCKRFPLSCLTVQESHFSRRYASKHVYVDPDLPASVGGWKHLKTVLTVYFLESVDLTLALQESWVLRCTPSLPSSDQ